MQNHHEKKRQEHIKVLGWFRQPDGLNNIWLSQPRYGHQYSIHCSTLRKNTKTWFTNGICIIMYYNFVWFGCKKFLRLTKDACMHNFIWYIICSRFWLCYFGQNFNALKSYNIQILYHSIWPTLWYSTCIALTSQLHSPLPCMPTLVSPVFLAASCLSQQQQHCGCEFQMKLG